jgi:ABC-2 type transport system permease protein
MMQMITPLIVGIIYFVILFRPGSTAFEGRGEAPEWFMRIIQSAMVYSNVGISLFIGWSLISRLGMIGFSQEGKNYWMLKTAPVGALRLLAGKFIVAYLPGFLLGLLFLVVISLIRSASLSILLFGLAVVLLSTLGSAGINVAFGVAGANLAWEDPRRMISGWSGCLSMLVSFAYLGVSLTLYFGPPLLLTVLGFPEGVGQAVGILGGGLFSLLCAVVPLWIAAGRVARIGDS